MKPRSDLHPYQRDATDTLIADDGRGLVAVDNIKWFSEQIPKRGWTLSVLVADESSKIKSPTAQRTQRMLELAMLARRRWTLTGTPRGQQLTDVWAPAQYCAAARLPLEEQSNTAIGDAT
jgi:hypothetical protein